MSEIVNIAGYQFVPLDGLPARKAQLLDLCRGLGLMGTILLAPEGINLFLAGERGAIDTFLATLREDEKLADFPVKESLSATQPFQHMWVKIKKAIIPFGDNSFAIDAAAGRRLSVDEFKKWLDEGRDMVVLDVRNTFEFEAGAFENSIPVGVDDFRTFPEAAARLPDEMKSRPVVTFCTGGIRCEKAAPYLESLGFRDVYQLEGGILKYFEEHGDAHYRGTCFVFDERVALDGDLQPQALGNSD